MSDHKSKPKLGPVQCPKKPYLWRQLFEHKVMEAFEGEKPGKDALVSKEGKATIAGAKSETSEFLGYSLEEAEKQDTVEDLARELRYNQERSGREEMEVDSPMEIM